MKQWYQKYWEGMRAHGCDVTRDLPGYARACSIKDENELCKDAGLPDNLFRGTHNPSGKKVVIKAVHNCSREFHAVRYIYSPSLRRHPMNHSIPVYDLIEVPTDSLVFIVMEEWYPQFMYEVPSTLRLFLSALRQCIEHIVFLHSHKMAHLDISIHNILTDYKGHYAFIDYECCRQFDDTLNPLIKGIRGTDIPPEIENGGWTDPYKTDVWQLAVLIIRACKITGYDVPELASLVRPMLHDDYNRRPSAAAVLRAFDGMVAGLHRERLDASCQ